ncbi:SAM-dependent methyltransferase [Planomicrobium sp. CPCC 101110]|uniref:class I SAM-dependent methyltransferase n=1 Tax=Planomicrobium sp. CPCC 101110 TaxID=2599619 RepID=UPI0011B420C8|nr:SAM-dependent methyltransferase [Planomicrobium sp. CPCC 101110]TWT24702.1 SAM-dependent methyltransferase [Planomicrobium sp. CPCC 101110]
MELQTMHAQLAERLRGRALVSATISQPRLKSNDVKRIKLKPVNIRNEYRIQFEYQHEHVLKHENLSIDEAAAKLESIFGDFRQALFQFTEEKIQVQLSKKFKVSWKSEGTSAKTVELSHNRKKQYLLEDGIPYPFLVRLGVQSADGKVKKQKYDKFRQINRFIEFIDDALEHLPKGRTVRILDFGSGKSYLTFALYHYLRIEKGLDLRVTGLDLKKEVIEECQKIADDLQYDQLEFLVGDINEYNEESAVDMVVTLHACDTATDMALSRAVKWNASVILSVPCCQHELNSQIAAPGLGLMLQHGLIKERFSALATDSVRAEILSLVGYETQLMEFIDLENTPKNILIRAYKTGKKPAAGQLERYKAFTQLLSADPFLENELQHLL